MKINDTIFVTNKKEIKMKGENMLILIFAIAIFIIGVIYAIKKKKIFGRIHPVIVWVPFAVILVGLSISIWNHNCNSVQAYVFAEKMTQRDSIVQRINTGDDSSHTDMIYFNRWVSATQDKRKSPIVGLYYDKAAEYIPVITYTNDVWYFRG